MNRLPLGSIFMLVLLRAPLTLSAPHSFFKITVTDNDTGKAISGARLETTNHIVHLSDRNGVVAFYEPGLMDQRVFFYVSKQGYEHAADGFGFRGKALDVREGASGALKLRRVAGPTGPDVTTDDDSQLVLLPVPAAAQRFRINIVDEMSGRGVPMVELRTATASYLTDSAGIIAFYDRASMGKDITFGVFSHGYEYASEEGKGQVTLKIIAGGSATLRIRRINIAERLYRMTGQGIYRESALLDLAAPTEAPLLNGGVMGQDSVLTTVYGGKIFWIWGDTSRASYPLGLFRAAGARSDLPVNGGLDPDMGVNLRYFVAADGFAREMAPERTVPGMGTTWLGSLISVPDGAGKEALFATYGKFGQDFKRFEHGIVRYSDAMEVFEKVRVLKEDERVDPHGHPLRWTHEDGEYVYYYNPVRIPALPAAMADPARFEAFTALVPGSATTLDRDVNGVPRYTWKTGAAPLSEKDVRSGLLEARDALFGHVTDIDTGEIISIHENSSTAYNAYRGRFVAILLQAFGKSSLVGEHYYAEADTPMGPWVYARKIITHDDYSFYNPRQHPFFDEDGGRRIYFEATYTALFSGARVPTPRYDYNQIMYRLDLDDPRLFLPVPIYDISEDGVPGRLTTRAGLRRSMTGPARRVFFAPDRPAPGTVPVHLSVCGAVRRLVLGAIPGATPLFHALPGDAVSPPPSTQPLYEYIHSVTSARAYSTDPQLGLEGFARAEAPLLHVYRDPLRVALPVRDYLGAAEPASLAEPCIEEPSPRPGGGCACQATGARSTEATLLFLIACALLRRRTGPA